MAKEKGYNCVLSLGGNAIGFAQNVSPNLTRDEMDATDRASAPWEDWRGGLMRLEFTVDAFWVPDQASYQAIETAIITDGNLAFVITDNNGYGWAGTCGVRGLDFSQALDDMGLFSGDFKSRGTVTQETAPS